MDKDRNTQKELDLSAAAQGVDADAAACEAVGAAKRDAKDRLSFLEFFAGSGLVAHALRAHFQVVWANDICKKKATVYLANHGARSFHLGSISDVNGAELPEAALSWASFPCQDLSLAGLTAGIHAKRSGLVWEWLRIMDEMPNTPPLLVAENVVGLVSSNGGSHYRLLHEALRARGYQAGAVVLDAARWLPQSRPRVFVIAVPQAAKIPQTLIGTRPSWLHPAAVVKAAEGLENWVWWSMPEPPQRRSGLSDIIEWNADCDPFDKAARNIAMIPERHRLMLEAQRNTVAPGYKRTRNARQVLELRFDNVAGCLRTPEGGSSRQVVVLKNGKEIKTRLLTVRETARLMGAPESYKLPGSYNDGYKAMGDGVAVPVARYLARQLLRPLFTAVQ